MEESCKGSSCKYTLTENNTKVKFESKNLSPSLIEEFKKNINSLFEPEAAILFERNRIGAAQLEQLKKKYMSIEINYSDEVISIYSNKIVDNLKDIEKEIKSLLKEISLSGDYTINDRCVYCGEELSLVKLLICGHFSCKECLKSLSKSSKIFPILCKACKCVIHIDNFLNQITTNEKDTLVKNAVKFYLKTNQETGGIKFCPLFNRF
jgi:hypothetical protein